MPGPSNLVLDKFKKQSGLVTVIEDDFFFLQPNPEEADRISAGLNWNNNDYSDLLKPGDPVIGKWDEGVYRATVLNVTNNSVKVIFGDYGNTEEIPISDLNMLSLEDSPEPFQAVKCKLVAGERLDEASLVESDYYFSVVVIEQNADHCLVAKSEELIYQRSTPQLGELIPVAVQYVEDQQNVWLIKAEDEEILDAMMNDLEEKLTSLAKAKGPLQIGQNCVTRFSDGSLYRCRVVDLSNNGNAKVFYIDYGNLDSKPIAELYDLPDFAKEYPGFCFSVKVLKPESGSGMSVEEMEQLYHCHAFLSEEKNCNGTFLCCLFYSDEDEEDVVVEGPVDVIPDVRKTVIEDQDPTSNGDSLAQNCPITDSNGDAKRLPLEIEIPTTVTYVESLYKVWVQFFPAGYDQLGSYLEKAKNALIPLTEIRQDKNCLVRSSTDGALLRGRIKAIKGDQVKVRMVDWGRLERCMKCQLFELTEALEAIPSCAVAVKIPENPAVPDTKEKKNFLKSVLLSGHTSCILHKMTSSAKGVLLVDHKELDYNTLFVETEKTLPVGNSGDVDVKIVKKLWIPKMDELEKEGNIDVRLSFIERTGEIWCVPAHFANKLDDMMDSIYEIGGTLSAMDPVKVNSVGITRWEDESFYRCLVVEKQNDYIKVFYVDKGGVEKKSASDILEIPREFTELPQMAIKFKVELSEAEINKLLEEDSFSLHYKVSENGENFGFLQAEKTDEAKEILRETQPGNTAHVRLLSSDSEMNATRVNSPPPAKMCPGEMIKTTTSIDDCSLESQCIKSPPPSKDSMVESVSTPLSNDASVGSQAREIISTPSSQDIIAAHEIQLTPPFKSCVRDGTDDLSVSATSSVNFHGDSSPATPPEGRIWRVGDRVAALWQHDRKWRHGVIHEIYKEEAMVVCKNELVKATIVPFTYLKSHRIPLEALNLVENELEESSDEMIPLANGQSAINNGNSAAEEVGDTSAHQLDIAGDRVTVGPKLSHPVPVIETRTTFSSYADILEFAKSSRGSRQLQELLTMRTVETETVKTSLIVEIEKDPIALINHSKACYVVQALIEVSEEQKLQVMVNVVCENFHLIALNQFGTYAIQALLKCCFAKNYLHLVQAIILKLENRRVLSNLLKSKTGCFIAQAIFKYGIQPRTVSFISNFLMGYVVEFGCHKTATYFIQKFIQYLKEINNPELKFLSEDVLNHADELALCHRGTYVLQEVVRNSDENDLIRAYNWLLSKIAILYKEESVNFTALAIIHQLKLRSQDPNCEKCRDLLEDFLVHLLKTLLVKKPLFIWLALDKFGQRIVLELLSVDRIQPDIKEQLKVVLATYSTVLKSDLYGMVVFKNCLHL